MKIGKYMTARHVGMAPHEVYTIHDRNHHVLATVEWYWRWKQYIVQPEHDAVFSVECLRDLTTFLEHCNRAEGKAPG